MRSFVNHYYLMRQLTEQGDDYPVRNFFLPGGDPGVTRQRRRRGILSTAPHPTAAQAFVDFLLNEESQQFFAEQTHEYPLADGVAAEEALPPLDELEPGHRPVGAIGPAGHAPAHAGRRGPLTVPRPMG